MDVSKTGFRFVYGPPSNSQLRTHLEKMPLPASTCEGFSYTTEVNLAAPRWVEDWSKVLGQGYILLADYGYPRDLYYSPERTQGTLMAYQEHRKSTNPLEAVGQCDLTAHVDFTTLAERAEASGMQMSGYCDQHHFLVALGEKELLAIERNIEEMTPELLHFIRSFKTLMHPSSMGMAFKFIGFEKNIPSQDRPLLGFSRCGDGRSVLGLGELHKVAQEHLDDPYAAF